MTSRDSVKHVHAVLRWWPTEFSITSSDREVLLWAHYHLSSAAAAIHERYVAHSIRVVTEPHLVTRLRARLSQGELSVFEPYPADVWAGGVIGGRRTWTRWNVMPNSPDSLVLIEESNRQWSLVAASAAAAKAAVVRLARELLRTELAQRGAYTFHAACAVTRRFDGLLFCGESGAGKTTLALAAAQTGYLVSGDQTELFSDGRGWVMAVGFPWSLRVAPATLRALGYGLDFHDLLVRPAATGGMTDKLEFSALETEILLRIPMLPAYPIRAIVVAREDVTLSSPVASLVRSAEVASLLAPHIREPDPSFGPFWLASDEQRPGAVQDLELLKAVVGDIPVIALGWVPREHQVHRTLEAIDGVLPPGRTGLR